MVATLQHPDDFSDLFRKEDQRDEVSSKCLTYVSNSLSETYA